MFTLLMTLCVIIAGMLVVVVLLQASKGTGLAGTFGGAAQMGAMFGTRRTADFLSKATWWLAGTLVVLALLINLFFLPNISSGDGKESIIQKGKVAVPSSPSVPKSNQ